MTGMTHKATSIPNDNKTTVSSDESIPVPIEPSAIWQALSATPGIGVCVLTAEGTCVHSSPEALRIYLDDPTIETVGRSLTDLFPKEWANERLAYIKQVVESRKPMAIRQVWRGVQMCMVIRPIIDCNDQVTNILMLTRPTQTLDSNAEFPIMAESEFIELGSLSVLTPRELVVLALLGQGMTLKEIAERLHRSFKTIDNHRASIGRKLEATDRLELARLASMAGLRVQDAELKRVEVSLGVKSLSSI